MAVAVVVAAPLSGNDAVAVINTRERGRNLRRWRRGVDLLERIVAMLTKLIDP